MLGNCFYTEPSLSCNLWRRITELQHHSKKKCVFVSSTQTWCKVPSSFIACAWRVQHQGLCHGSAGGERQGWAQAKEHGHWWFLEVSSRLWGLYWRWWIYWPFLVAFSRCWTKVSFTLHNNYFISWALEQNLVLKFLLWIMLLNVWNDLMNDNTIHWKKEVICLHVLARAIIHFTNGSPLISSDKVSSWLMDCSQKYLVCRWVSWDVSIKPLLTTDLRQWHSHSAV